MKTLLYSLTIAFLLSVFFSTFHMENSLDAHATCVTINGTEECSTPPPIWTSIQSYYVPAQTIYLVGISRSNSMVQVDLIDPNNDTEGSVVFQSESSGRFQNQLVVPVDAINGTWKINISSGITHRTYHITVISPIHKENQTNHMLNMCCGTPMKLIIYSPLKQFKSGIAAKDVKCKEGLQLIIKSSNGFPACVKPQTAQKLLERGWAKSQENSSLVILKEGQREGSLLVQKIFSDNVQGLNFLEYPLATNVGHSVTLHIGDSISDGCVVMLTLVKIENNTATFLKKEDHTRLCPICLSENTMIDTPDGPVNVKKIIVGMAVFTQDSSAHKQSVIISKTGRTPAPQGHMMIHLVLDDKRELFTSPNHPTADGRLFGSLSIGDKLDGSVITSAELVPYNGTYTYDILPSGPTGTYWANGILVGSTLK